MQAQHASAPVTMLGLKTQKLFLEIWDRVKDDATIADLQSNQLSDLKKWVSKVLSGAVAKVKVLHDQQGGYHE